MSIGDLVGLYAALGSVVAFFTLCVLPAWHGKTMRRWTLYVPSEAPDSVSVGVALIVLVASFVVWPYAVFRMIVTLVRVGIATHRAIAAKRATKASPLPKATVLLVLLLAGLGCKKRESDTAPPPIAQGTCQVIQYDGAVKAQQWCSWSGAWWLCTESRCSRQDNVKAPTPAKAEAGL